MRALNRNTLIVIGVFITLLTISQIIQKKSWKLGKFSSGIFDIAGGKQLSKFATVPVPDYVLNYSKPIQLPLQCIPFSTIRGNIPICVHDNPKEFITKHIRAEGTWENGHCVAIQKLLVANPDYGFLDIGANLGMFSLLAANLQRPSLAVEAMDINIRKFHQSIFVNHFEEYIKVVTRPLSDKYETIQINVGVNNLGRSRLKEYWNHKKIFKEYVLHENKTTMMLDDLIDLVPRKKAIMVMDVEGNEGKIIRGGQKFFDAIHISHVFMEWNLLYGHEKKFLVGFFTKRGYIPYDSPSFEHTLHLSRFITWPIDIFWRKE